MIGSVKSADTWLLLEYEGSLGVQALAESVIPEPVKLKLSETVEASSSIRILMIKSHHQEIGSGIKFIVARGHETDPYYIQFDLETYEDLLDFDLNAILEGRNMQGGEIAVEPLFLVCTNGRRDPCCAQAGLPLYQALWERAADHVWECSHVGGHRFAANVLVFPHGVCYGRVSPTDADDLIASAENGDLLIEHYRGRACYEKHVQAAEAHLRRQTGKLGCDDFVLQEVEFIADAAWRVFFKEAGSEARHAISVEMSKSTEMEYVSCRDNKRSPIISYRLINYEAA